MAAKVDQSGRRGAICTSWAGRPPAATNCVRPLRSTRRASVGDRLHFADFVFDRRTETLWTGDEPVALRPKSAAVLALLLDHGGEVVSKDTMLAAVWPEGFVGDDVLAGCIRELRAVLGDDARDPRFIATVHRRGYRVITPVSLTGPLAAAGGDVIVGRDRELASMREWWNGVRLGGPRVAFIAGDAGIGKSTLVGRFVDELRRSEHILVGRGHCVEQAGGGEPYLPFLDALTGLCRDIDGDHVRGVLRRHAPSWLLQLPGLVDESERATLMLGATKPDRMMRELADALHAVSIVRPIVLVCEDLHAADRATTELLAYLARHPQPARVLVLCTYRPTEALARCHPLRGVVSDLRGRQTCRHLDLDPLTPAAAEDYLEQRLSPRRPSAELVADVTARSDGNALFLVTLLEHLIACDLLIDGTDGLVHSRGELPSSGIPDSIRHLIARQLDEHEPDVRALLEVAAIIGIEFTATAVCAALPACDAVAAARVEDTLHSLASSAALIMPVGSAALSGGAATGRYRFRYTMCREVLDAGVDSATRRATIHRRIGSRRSPHGGPEHPDPITADGLFEEVA